MSIVRGVDEGGEATFYDVPDEELAKHKISMKPLTDEDRQRLFPGKDKPSKDDAQGVIPAGRSTSGGDVEGYAAICWYYVDDGYGNWVYWEEYC